MSENLNSPNPDEATPTQTPGPSASQTPVPRSVSNTPYWAPHHMGESQSYFPPSSPRLRPASPVAGTGRRSMNNRFPRTHSSQSISGQGRRATGRSNSVASSSFNSRGVVGGDTGTFSEAEEEDREYEADDDGGSPLTRRGRGSSLPRSVHDALAAGEDTTPDGGSIERVFNEDDPLTVKDRQSLINVQHPFGLPIWKPALYKKSRTVTRNAETELHSQPAQVVETRDIPGNVAWTLLFGWWMAAIFLVPAALLYLVPRGGRQYSRLVYGLAWYLFWPFGKFVQGDGPEEEKDAEDDDGSDIQSSRMEHHGGAASETSTGTVRGPTSPQAPRHQDSADSNPFTSSGSWNSVREPPYHDTTALLRNETLKSYGSVPVDLGPTFDAIEDAKRHWLGRACFWLFLVVLIAPVMLVACLICWACVITIPMAKLQWELLLHLFHRHNTIQFCSAPTEVIERLTRPESGTSEANGVGTPVQSSFTVKSAPRLYVGQSAPNGRPQSTVLLCTYRAVGLKYYKYTVGGVNILFVNLVPLVFLVIADGFFLLPYVERKHENHEHVPPVLDFFASQALLFVMSLASVIPLSYFIGMAVASISAQSSIGMGAVINATFGSIIEIILYSIALTQGKGLLVEGSIVGSLLAGVGLMPGVSMISGAMRKKEQRFNAKSAGVTSTMLIMAIIGTLTPTLFYQTYGNFELVCDGCPVVIPGMTNLTRPHHHETWRCRQCYYRHPNPVDDPFYQGTVKQLMYLCSGVLLFAYLIGLWFSLRTHASQIWQNPQPLMHPLDLTNLPGGSNTAGRNSLYNRIVASHLAQQIPQQTNKLLRKASILGGGSIRGRDDRTDGPSNVNTPYLGSSQTAGGLPSPNLRRVSYVRHNSGDAAYSPSRHAGPSTGYGPILETVTSAAKDPSQQALPLPANMTTEDFTRAVAVTVSALRHGDAHDVEAAGGHEGPGEHGGHEAPSWSRATSAAVLLSCTVLYAAIAEILVDVVDVVLQGSGIDEKFLGIILFALVPNITEFMNAISFAMNGNIALSMEIGSAYGLQVCLLQIPAMVAFSAWYDPREVGSIASTFTMVFPRWDAIAIILSIFLLTYTYIEAKSNYHRGSTLCLSYFVLIAGFYFAPSKLESESSTRWFSGTSTDLSNALPNISSLQTLQTMFLSLFTR